MAFSKNYDKNRQRVFVVYKFQSLCDRLNDMYDLDAIPLKWVNMEKLRENDIVVGTLSVGVAQKIMVTGARYINVEFPRFEKGSFTTDDLYNGMILQEMYIEKVGDTIDNQFPLDPPDSPVLED